MQRLAAPVLLAVVGLYFAWYTVNGERGIRALERLRVEVQQSQQELAMVTEQKHALEKRVQALRPDSLDLDLLDEQARATLNFNNSNEMIILMQAQPVAAHPPQ